MTLTRITSDGITDAAIVNADINASAAIAGSKISPDFGGQNVTTTGNVNGSNLILSHTTPTIQLNDSNNNPDYVLQNNNGVFRIRDNTNSADRLVVNTDGHVDVAGNLDVGAGIDVTGASSFDGFITLSSTHNRIIFTDTNADPDYMVDSNGGHFLVYDATNNVDKIKIFSDGHTDIHGNVDFISGGIDVTGAITGTGDLTIDTNTLHVDSSNNRVGIGTTSPSNSLDIGSGNIQFSGGNGSALTWSADVSSHYLKFTTALNGLTLNGYGGLAFETAGANERMRIDSSGNVGIGTTSPSNLLTLTHSANASDGLIVKNTNNSQGSAVAIVSIRGGDNASGRLEIECNGQNHNLIEDSVGNLTIEDNGTERMRINSDGDVLIGRTTTIDTSEVFGIQGPSGDHATFGITTDGTTNMGIISFNDGGGNFMGQIRYQHSTDSMQFFTPGSERMRIGSSGFVGIGTTTADKNLVVKRSGNVVVAGIEADAASAVNIDLSSSISTGRAFFFRFLYNGNITGNVYSDGSTTVYNTGSDYRLKENVVGISDGITRLKALKPSRFNFKRDSSTTVDGFLAHEVSSIVPEAISGTKDEVATEDNEETGVKKGDPIYQGIDQSKLVPLLVAALQEAIVRIEALEAK